jgi:hypothetical protein
MRAPATILAEMNPRHPQRFLYTVTLASLILWAVWIYILTHLPPNNVAHYVFFLASFFFALTTALTMLFYKLAYRGATVHHSYINPRAVITHCFRRAGLFSGVITASASLKILGALSTLTFFSLILLAFLLEVYFMRRH